jgi:tRNA pseudouridine13 synthase
MLIKQIPEDFIVEEITNVKITPNGRNTVFKLIKRECTTENAIQHLSRFFKIERRRIGYAGNKDKFAVTTQYCSALGRIRSAKFNRFEIVVIGYSDEPINLGSLTGNKFRIVVRDIDKKPKKISQIINYFDEQRFSKNNALIGRLILKKDFKSAATLIENPDVKSHLEKYPNDYIGAIQRLPLMIQTMMINSYQSLLWNKVASELAEKSKGVTRIPYSQGELVFPKRKIKNINVPLFSFDTKLDKYLEDKYEKLLKEDSLTRRDFIIRSIPRLTTQGASRDLVVAVMDLQISRLENDEINKDRKKTTVEFFLQKGSYATIAIKRMFLDEIVN